MTVSALVFGKRNSLACTYMLMCVQGWSVGMSLRLRVQNVLGIFEANKLSR